MYTDSLKHKPMTNSPWLAMTTMGLIHVRVANSNPVSCHTGLQSL